MDKEQIAPIKATELYEKANELVNLLELSVTVGVNFAQVQPEAMKQLIKDLEHDLFNFETRIDELE